MFDQSMSIKKSSASILISKEPAKFEWLEVLFIHMEQHFMCRLSGSLHQ